MSLAGALRKRGSPPDYTGVLIAHLGPYGLTAFGGYGQFTGPDGGKYTALFVIAGITAPIGGPPAFFVTGLGGGAGVNRQLVLPANLDDFPSYPLVAAIDPHSTLASDPEKALDELSAAFPPERGNFWFAAGVSFTSFALIDVTAVIAVSVGDGLRGRSARTGPDGAADHVRAAGRGGTRAAGGVFHQGGRRSSSRPS